MSENEQLLQTFVKFLDYLRANVELCNIGVLCRVVESIITLIGIQCCGLEYVNSGDHDERETSKENVLAKGVPEKLLIFLSKAMGIVNFFFKEKRAQRLDYCQEIEVKLELQVGIV